jgi:hypothetical protein
MVNNISNVYEGKQTKKDSKYLKYYILDTDVLKASYKLDKFNDKIRAYYCYDTLVQISLKKPKEEEVFRCYASDDEKPEVYDLDM